jgi:hypothetical protein
VGKPRLKKFVKASHDLKGSQQAVLQELIELNKDTAFGKEHGFDKIKTIEDYRKAVPIRTFEDHRPYVDRITNGEADVLCPDKPLFYTTTSGTTTKAKYIPVFKDFFAKHNGMSKIWLYSCLADNPGLYDGQSLSMVAPAEEGNVADGTPYGSISGVTYRNIPSVLKSTHSAPYPVVCIKDHEKKYYALMRGGLAANITFIISASPSNVLRMHQVAMENYEDLVRDIRDGTMRKDVAEEIEPADREQALAYYHPDAGRAAFLQKIMDEHGENLRPRHIWPQLACVNCWRQGSFTVMIPKFEGYFPEKTSIRGFGYWSSEFRGGFVFGNDWDYSVLTAHAYLYDFIEESERDTANPTVVGPEQLDAGKRYFIICSNGSGLYRYDINDMIEITGHYNQYPLFKFIRRGEGETDIAGEKLSEPQVIEAVRQAAVKENIQVPFFTMVCDKASEKYKLFAEFAPDTPADKKAEFVDEVDRKLLSYNYEYERKRGSKRLEAPVLAEMKSNSYEALKTALCNAGLARAGQYKDVYLRRGETHLRFFEELAL